MNSTSYDLWHEITKSKDRTVYVGNDKSKIRAFNELRNADFIKQESYIDRNGILHAYLGIDDK